MRLWKNAKGDLITDEQLVAYIAFHGGLSQVLAAGDVSLVSGNDSDPYSPKTGHQRKKPRRDHASLASRL
jgi:hypothetical protein